MRAPQGRERRFGIGFVADVHAALLHRRGHRRAGGGCIIHGAGFRRANGQSGQRFVQILKARIVVGLGAVGNHHQSAGQRYQRKHHPHPRQLAAHAHMVGVQRKQHAMREIPARRFAKLHAVSTPARVGVGGHAHCVAHADRLAQHAPAGQVIHVLAQALARRAHIGDLPRARLLRLQTAQTNRLLKTVEQQMAQRIALAIGVARLAERAVIGRDLLFERFGRAIDDVLNPVAADQTAVCVGQAAAERLGGRAIGQRRVRPDSRLKTAGVNGVYDAGMAVREFVVDVNPAVGHVFARRGRHELLLIAVVDLHVFHAVVFQRLQRLRVAIEIRLRDFGMIRLPRAPAGDRLRIRAEEPRLVLGIAQMLAVIPRANQQDERLCAEGYGHAGGIGAVFAFHARAVPVKGVAVPGKQQIPIREIHSVCAEQQRPPALAEDRLAALSALRAHIPHFNRRAEAHAHLRFHLRPHQELLNERGGLEIAVGMIAQSGRDLAVEFKFDQIHAVEREVVNARIGIAAEARVGCGRVRANDIIAVREHVFHRRGNHRRAGRYKAFGFNFLVHVSVLAFLN